MTYRQLRLKNKIENFFIFPFIVIGRIVFLLGKKGKAYDTFFFFPFYHTGGAEKVHVQITEAVASKNSIIFFTRKSKDETFLSSFKNTNCEIRDISGYTDNKFLYFLNLICRGYISGLINAQNQNIIVFNGQCNFGYKISPWINKRAIQMELTHALNTFSYIRIPFLVRYKILLTVSQEIVDKHLQAYENIHVPKSLLSNFGFIETKIQLPGKQAVKDYYSLPLKILYVGRGTAEKRVHIVAKVAEKIFNKKLFIEFHFAGNVTDSVPLLLRRYCIFHGNVSDEKSLNGLYEKSHVLIVSSSTESGPLVIMEAMARGLAIVTTDVGFVPDYMKDEVNGFKVPAFEKEEEIAALMSSFVEKLYYDRKKLAGMGNNNVELAFNQFDLKIFKTSYQTLFNKFR